MILGLKTSVNNLLGPMSSCFKCLITPVIPHNSLPAPVFSDSPQYRELHNVKYGEHEMTRVVTMQRHSPNE